MGHSWNRAGTATNHVLRMVCAWIMISGQGVISLGGCSQDQNLMDNENQNGIVGSNDNNMNLNQNSSGNDTGDDSNEQGSGDSNGSTDVPAIDGYWISERDHNGATLRGLATGGQLGDVVNMAITEEDGGGWNFNGSLDGDGLDGTCSPAFFDDDFDLNDLFSEPLTCRGEFADDNNTITLTANGDSEQLSWFLRRPADPSSELIGSWADNVTTQRLICAYDGAVLSVLDPSDTTRRFDAVWSESGAFVGTDSDGGLWTALPDDEGRELFVWIDNGNTFSAKAYARDDEPANMPVPLTGRWMSSYNNGGTTNALRGQASVIFDGTHFYVHQRDDDHRVLFESDYTTGAYWSIFATFDGLRFQSTADSTTTWSGYVDATGTTIQGHWNGDQTRSFGFTRAGDPDAAILSGTWTSLSADYETPSSPTQTTGQAQLSFDGTTLRIEDNYENADYVIEAEWRDDHFEGNWWSLDEPDNLLRWSGEVVLDGAMLHGKWEYGEWSFSPFTLQAHETLDEVTEGTFAVVADPFDNILAAYRDTEEDIAVTVYREEGIVNRYSIVAPSGQVEVTVDERYRPVSISATDVNADFVWADDASSVDLTIYQNGTTTSETVMLDLSDAALQTALTEMASATGTDVAGLRAWIDDYPGLVQVIASGDGRLVSLQADQTTRVRGAAGLGLPPVVRVANRIVGDATAISALMLGAVAAGSHVFVVTGAPAFSAALGAAFAGLGFLATAAAGIVIAFFLADFIFSCFPCTLSCFWNCFE